MLVAISQQFSQSQRSLKRRLRASNGLWRSCRPRLRHSGISTSRARDARDRLRARVRNRSESRAGQFARMIQRGAEFQIAAGSAAFASVQVGGARPMVVGRYAQSGAGRARRRREA